MVDYEGDYQRFVEKNEDEAVKMAEKEERRREIEKSQIKAKSKVRSPDLSYLGGSRVML